MYASPAFAAQSGAAAGGTAMGTIVGIAPWLLVFAIWFYFLILRPQQQRTKQHQQMMAAIKKNDVVVTSGGLIGKVTRVEEKELELEIASGVKVKIVKSMISEVRSHGAKPAND